MLEGTVIKAAGGFFTVRHGSGTNFVCRARGNLKRGRSSVIVGDLVRFQPEHPADPKTSGPAGESPAARGVIEEKLPRRTELSRPQVANIDQLIVVMSLKDPPCDWQQTSRMFVLAESESMDALLCLNKLDLITEAELEQVKEQAGFYPYPVFYTSALTGTGIDELKVKLARSCSVMAGPSGVGKSSLLNAIQPGLALQTGSVSDKIRRGRHTTRQAELMPLESGGMVVDTPGFSRLELTGIDKGELSSYFPELEQLRSGCAFRNCLHLQEPGCAVRQEVGVSINPERYRHYKYFMAEISSNAEG